MILNWRVRDFRFQIPDTTTGTLLYLADTPTTKGNIVFITDFVLSNRFGYFQTDF